MAYDAQVHAAQSYLSQLGYSPGAIDGAWGPNTLGAALDFRQLEGVGPAMGVDKSSVLDSAFWAALGVAANEAGIFYGGVPTASTPKPSPLPGAAGAPSTSVTPTAPTPGASAMPTWLLPAGIMGIGALFLLAGRRRR